MKNYVGTSLVIVTLLATAASQAQISGSVKSGNSRQTERLAEPMQFGYRSETITAADVFGVAAREAVGDVEINKSQTLYVVQDGKKKCTVSIKGTWAKAKLKLGSGQDNGIVAVEASKSTTGDVTTTKDPVFSWTKFTLSDGSVCTVTKLTNGDIGSRKTSEIYDCIGVPVQAKNCR
jgi:hypothetical protein